MQNNPNPPPRLYDILALSFTVQMVQRGGRSSDDDDSYDDGVGMQRRNQPSASLGFSEVFSFYFVCVFTCVLESDSTETNIDF